MHRPFMLVAAVMLSTAAAEPKFSVHRVKSWDGTELDLNAWVPSKGGAGELPVVVFINSWGMPSIEYEAPVYRFAKRGYVGIEYEARGFYGSGGQIGTAGPDDVKDVSAIIDWVLKKYPEADKNKIALGGISYGGGLSLLGAGSDPRVKAVLAMSSWESLVDALWWQTAPSLVWSALLMDAAKVTGRPPPILFEILDDVMNYKNVSFATQWAIERSPIRVLDNLNSRKVPIFMSNNQEDNLFHSNFQLDFWNKLTGPKRLFLNQGTHAQAELSGLLPGDKFNEIWEAADKWLDHFLKGVQNKIEEPPLIQITLGNKEAPLVEKVHYDSWPPLDHAYEVTDYKLDSYRGKERFATLSKKQSGTAHPDTIQYTNKTEMTCGLPIVAPVLKPYIPIKSNLRRVKHEHELVYVTERFEKEARVCGNVKLTNLWVVPNQDRFSVYGYLFSFDPTLVRDEGTLITHSPAGVWANATAHQEFLVQDMEFRCACVDIKRGHHIALGINMHNNLYKAAGSDAALNLTVTYSHGAPTLSVPFVDRKKKAQ